MQKTCGHANGKKFCAKFFVPLPLKTHKTDVEADVAIKKLPPHPC